mgnify:CR=1 FL=1
MITKLKNTYIRNKNINLLFKLYYLILFLLTSSVLISLILSNNVYNKEIKDLNFKNLSSDGSKNSIEGLYTVKLFEENKLASQINIDQIRKTKIVPNLILAKLPSDLKNVKSVQTRKEIFIKIALPLIIKENEKLDKINKKLKIIKNKIDHLSREDALWISDLMSEYDEYSINHLLLKVDAIPVSLALAQAVIESGWGTSRFAYEGNALFGQYVWDNKTDGIIPNERSIDAKYKIKSFSSLRDSVASYMKNLNTNHHYDEFRINRYVMRSNEIPLDGAYLADYLYNYSIEKDYPVKIKNIIRMNNFLDFENLIIDKNSFPKETVDII